MARQGDEGKAAGIGMQTEGNTAHQIMISQQKTPKATQQADHSAAGSAAAALPATHSQPAASLRASGICEDRKTMKAVFA